MTLIDIVHFIDDFPSVEPLVIRIIQHETLQSITNLRIWQGGQVDLHLVHYGCGCPTPTSTSFLRWAVL